MTLGFDVTMLCISQQDHVSVIQKKNFKLYGVLTFKIQVHKESTGAKVGSDSSSKS